MEQQQWSEWIEWKGGECPIPGVKEWWYRFRDGEEGRVHRELAESCRWHHRDNCADIVAYRVRLTAQQPAEPRKAKASDFEVVRWPDLPETESDRDIDIGDGVDENAAMLARDSAGMVKAKAEQPEPAPRVERCPLLVVAPMERLGATRWGA